MKIASLPDLFITISFFKKDFLMWIIFKVFIEIALILLLFYIFIFVAGRHVGS